ncbi:glycosyltransferase [Halobium salinum]|uniref:Glycosyltransferase n=1 Tax=Halobium salinum TaxID=1364940 RepID=A0ABD5PDM0_9EURY|nr:glycosyltransferase [Halobium salinum]
MSRSVGVVVPAYRPDTARLAAYVRALDERLRPATIRIELDDPRPGVVDELRGLPATVRTVPRRRGKGAAVTAGFEALDTDVLLFVDADGSTPAESVARVLDPVVDGEADLSVGSRRHPDSVVASHQTFARRRLGDGFAWLARRLLEAELFDYQCGAKALTATTWETVRPHLYEPGFAWDVEFVAVAGALDRRIAEVPVRWEDQPGSTVDPVGASVDMARSLLVSRHRAKLIRENRLHALLDAGRTEELALVDRFTPEPADE